MRASLASFDVLWLAGSIADTADGLTQGEMHTLDYLACLLAIYDGYAPDWWGFGFSVTDSGAPFAREIAGALGTLVNARWVRHEGRVYRLTPLGGDELSFERTLAPNRRRERRQGDASLLGVWISQTPRPGCAPICVGRPIGWKPRKSNLALPRSR